VNPPETPWSSYPCQLSLAIPPWLGAVSIGNGSLIATAKGKKRRVLLSSFTIGLQPVGIGKGKGNCIAVHGTPSHSYGVSLAIWDHTVLSGTRHK